MRYFFHLDGDSNSDDTGIELPDVAAVKRQAVLCARDLLNDDDSTLWDGSRFEMRVVNDAGEVIVRLRFEMIDEALRETMRG